MFEDFERYLMEKDSSLATVRGYLSDLPIFVRWFEQTNGETFSPKAVTPADIREFRQDSLRQKKLAANTINRRLSALSAYFAFLLETGEIVQNPVAGIRKVDAPKAMPHWLDKKEQYRLSRIMEQDLQFARQHYPKRWLSRQRDFSLVSLLKNSGLRVLEAAHLEISDLTLSERKGSLLVRKGKGNKQRTIPLNADARKALQDWLDLRPDVTGNDFVFIALESDAHGALSSRTIQRIVERYGKKADLPDLTPHVLRHTFAKNLVNSGVSLEKVAALLGHSSLDTTRIYITPSLKDLEQAVEKIENH